MKNKNYETLSLYGNSIGRKNSKKVLRRQAYLKRKFKYDPNEKYNLHLKDNPHLGPIFGVKDIVREDEGEEIDKT